MRRDIASRSGAMGHVGDDRSSPAIPRTTRQICGPKGSKGWNLDAFVGNQGMASAPSEKDRAIRLSTELFLRTSSSSMWHSAYCP